MTSIKSFAAPAMWADLGFRPLPPPVRSSRSDLTAAEARARLRYDPDTGVIYRVGGKKSGEPLKTYPNSNGYRLVFVADRMHLMHRVIWLLVHGQFPRGQIDHINRDRTDNRLANLRDVPPSHNSQNRSVEPKATKSGFVGVARNGRRWAARITVGGRYQHIGQFDTPKEAFDAYLEAKARLHPGYVPAAGEVTT